MRTPNVIEGKVTAVPAGSDEAVGRRDHRRGEQLLPPYNISFYVKRSIYCHLAFILLLLTIQGIRTFFLEGNNRRTAIKLVPPSIRVDVIAMPELSLKELKNLSLKKTDWKEKFVKEDQDPAVVNFLKHKEEKFQEMLKKIGQKKVKKKKKKKKGKGKEIGNRERRKLRKLVVKGNILSKGSALWGEGISEVSGEFSSYITQLPAWVRPHWTLPSYFADKKLQCRIRIFLSPSGRLLKTEIFSSSGNEEYDKKALMAVMASSPFPQFSAQIKHRVLKGDIILGFPL